MILSKPKALKTYFREKYVKFKSRKLDETFLKTKLVKLKINSKNIKKISNVLTVNSRNIIEEHHLRKQFLSFSRMKKTPKTIWFYNEIF